MRAVGQAASGKAEDDGCISNTAEDDNAASRVWAPIRAARDSQDAP
jgi:hypothetical protein